VLQELVEDQIAVIFDVNIEDITVHLSSPEDFLLLFPSEELPLQVLNGDMVFSTPSFSLKFKCWSRFAHVDASSLQCKVSMLFQGIPRSTHGS
jgi:hypothetical protein